MEFDVFLVAFWGRKTGSAAEMSPKAKRAAIKADFGPLDESKGESQPNDGVAFTSGGHGFEAISDVSKDVSKLTTSVKSQIHFRFTC